MALADAGVAAANLADSRKAIPPSAPSITVLHKKFTNKLFNSQLGFISFCVSSVKHWHYAGLYKKSGLDGIVACTMVAFVYSTLATLE